MMPPLEQNASPGDADELPDLSPQLPSVGSANATALPPAILLAGPTACGKTALAMQLVDRFAADLPLEIVSVDSAQVYIGLDIGTAKPDKATLARYPHHLIDLVPPDVPYSAGRFLADARRVMEEITTRGHVPLLVGGSMLYFKVLLEGIAELPQADAALRAAIDAEAAAKGWPALHAELARLDPVAAARIDPHHTQRIQRALELVRLSGMPLDALYQAQTSAAPRYRFLNLALVPGDRAALHARIAERFRAMLANGLVAEVEGLRARYDLHPDLPAMRAAGYRQVWEFLDASIDDAGLVEKGIAATRQLAKRQLTWLRSLPFAPLEPLAPELAAIAENRVRDFLTDAKTAQLSRCS